MSTSNSGRGPLFWTAAGAARYVVAVASVAVLMGVYVALRAQFVSAPASLLLVAVVAAAWFGGRGAGIAATVLAVALAGLFLLHSKDGWWALSVVDGLRLGSIALTGTVVSVLFGALQNARARAQASASEHRGAVAELSAERARLAALLEHMPVGAVLADAQGRIVLANRQLEAILGHPVIHNADREALREYAALHPTEDRPLRLDEYPIVRAVRGETLANQEVRYRRPDGRIVWLRVSGAPIRDAQGHVAGGVDLFWNIDREKEAEQASQAERARLSLAESAAGLGHFDWDIVADVNIWSPQLEALYGLAPGSFGGTYEAWQRCVHPEDLERATAEAQRALETGELDAEWRVVHADGGVRWLLARGRVFFDAAGRPVRMIGINMDITARKEAEDALRATELRLELALSAARLGAWHLDLASGRMDCTAGCKANFGRPPDARFDYADLLEAIHPEDRESMRARVETALATHRDYAAEYRVRWPDGSMHWIAARGRPTYDAAGKPLFMEGVTQDITERRHLEDTLRSQAEALRDADRRKDQFLATLSHELRNPLQAIQAAVQVMQARGDDAAVLARAGTIIERQSRQMWRLVDDLLEVARIAEGKLDLRPLPVDAREIVSIATDTVRPQLEQRKQRLVVAPAETPLVVTGDSGRLTQVLVNLLNNASKYTGEGGAIRVSAAREDGHVVVRVADNGVGIPPEMLPKVFDLFAQVDDHRELSQGGLGLGLTLVERLVRMHGGDVSAHSDGPGRGSEFVVRLPVAS